MKKYVSLFIFTLLLYTLVPTVAAEKVTIDSDVLKKILEKQKTLEKKVKALENQPSTGESSKIIKYLQEDAIDIGERLDKIETKSILDRVTIGGEFRTRVEAFHYDDYADPLTGKKTDHDIDEIFSSRLRLNLKAKIAENIIFHGRLTYFKLWGDSDFATAARDSSYPSVPNSEGDLHVERAYIDWFIPKTPVSITFGRVPTSEGPPNELRENTTRKGTWPKLVVDGEIDAIFVNTSLDKWTGLTNSMFRVAYVHLYQNNARETGLDLDDGFSPVFVFETEVPGIKDSLFWISYVKIENLPPLTQKLIPASFPFAVDSTPDDAGYLDLFNLHLQFNNIKNSGLDLFLSGAYIEFSPRSEGTVFSTPAGFEVGIYGDNLSNNLGDDRDGHAVFAGLRYKLPVGGVYAPKIGFEYNYGSKYWTGFLSDGCGDMVNKLGTNGDAYELYYIQPVDEKHLFFRAGAVYMDFDYNNPMAIYGSRQKSDMSITNFYLLADVRF